MDYIWIIIGLAAVCVFTAIVVAVSAGINRSRASGAREKRTGYQEVLVRNGVDIKSMKYIHEMPHFPNQEGIEAFPTIVSEENMQHRTIFLTDQNTGTQYRMSFAGQLIIGRDPAAKKDDTRFIVSDGRVSKTHCRIMARGKELELADLNSKNGTYINGKMLSGTGLLHSGDRIMIGNTTLIIKFDKGK